MNVFEAQLGFLRSVKQMIADEELFVEGEDEIGFETLLEEYETKAAAIEERLLP